MEVKDPLGNHHALIFIDDIGFEKICFDDDYAYMFAGDGSLIQMWKQWISSPVKSLLQIPNIPDGMPFSICIVDCSSGFIKADFGVISGGLLVRFAGSGREPARECWSKNKCARKAVMSAIAIDRCSGGNVKYLEISSKKNNLNDVNSIADVSRELKTKGKVMFPNQHGIVKSIADVDDQFVQKQVDKIVAGEASLGAPVGDAHATWTSEDNEKLHSVMKEIFKL